MIFKLCATVYFMYCISGVFLKSLAFSRTEDRLDERVLSCLSYQSYPLPLLPCDSQGVSCLTFLATQTLSLSEKRVHTTRRQKALYIKIRVMPRLPILPDFAKSDSLRLHCESDLAKSARISYILDPRCYLSITLSFIYTGQ